MSLSMDMDGIFLVHSHAFIQSFFLAQRINRPPQEATSHFLEVYKELLVYCSPWY